MSYEWITTQAKELANFEKKQKQKGGHAQSLDNSYKCKVKWLPVDIDVIWGSVACVGTWDALKVHLSWACTEERKRGGTLGKPPR